MERLTSQCLMETSFIAQPCNILVHFLALEMYVSLRQSAMEKNLSVFMIQQLCGHQMWLRAVFVYVCWSRVLVQMDPPSWTGLRFEAHPLECWTAPPPSVHSQVVQNVQESTLHRYGSNLNWVITTLKGIRVFWEFFRQICDKREKVSPIPIDTCRI